MKYKSYFALFIFSLFLISFVNAQTALYIRNNEGQFLQKVDFDETSLNQSFKINFYCTYISIFKKQKCVSEQEYQFLTNITLPKIDTKGSLAINDNISPVEIATTTTTTSSPTIVTKPQIIYQIIERAVPGPQGPAGRNGVDGKDGVNSTIASFFPNTSVGSQYLGYGNNSANPTGTGNLSSLSVTGDSSFGGKISGAGLLSCNTLSSKILYNSTTGQFECGTDQGGAGFSGGNITGQNIFATTSLQTPVIYASTSYATSSNINTATITNLFVPNALLTFATLTSATITNIYSASASISAATTTNFFSSVLNSLTSTFTNLLFTNATGTNATTTNLSTTNFSATGYSNLTNLIATNATFSYATVTNGFFTNLSVTGPVEAALNNGYIFRGGTNNISEATSTLFVADSGKVGIGSTTPSEKLSVQGNLLVSGNIINPKITGLSNSTAGTDKILCVTSTGQVMIDNGGNCFSNYSDINLKKNIATVTSVLEKVSQLNTVNFNWIDEDRGTSTQLGYIAQDVQKVFPEVVKEDGNGFLKVNYVSLSAIYTNAIKELLEKVLGITSRVDKLEARMVELENKLNGQNTLQNNNQNLNNSAWQDTNSATSTVSSTTSQIIGENENNLTASSTENIQINREESVNTTSTQVQ